MRKFISALIAAALSLTCGAAMAEQTEGKPKSSRVTITIDVEEVPNISAADAKLELYSEEGQLLSSESRHIDAETKELEYVFAVPDYEFGRSYRLRLVSGLESLVYYTDRYYQGQDIAFSTYAYTDESGALVSSDGIALTAVPLYTRSVALSYGGVPLTLYPAAKLIDGTAMVPIRQLAEYIGFDVEYNAEYNVEIVSLGADRIYFNLDTAYTTAFGEDIFAKAATRSIDGTVYVALRTFADAIGSELTVTEYPKSLDIAMGGSERVNDYYLSVPVNQWGIASRTDYMVWVSKSEYRVRLYEGKQYQWKQILEAPCAIGAPGTPTVTGSYEYKYKTQWNYNGYYVGPCLVFYGGYALHSVLLRYDNSEYDGRTGVQISHGCIRLKKADIDYIANTIPVGTRIYITN